MAINWKRCKDDIIDGLDISIKGKISIRNVTEQPLTRLIKIFELKN